MFGATPHLKGWNIGQRVPFERFELNLDHPLARDLVFWLPSKPQIGVNSPHDMSIYKWPLTVENGGAIGYVFDSEKGWVREFDDASSDCCIINHYAYQDFNGFVGTQIVDVNLHDTSGSNGAIGVMDSIGSGGFYLLYRLTDASVVARLWQNTGETSTCAEVDSNVTTNEWRQWCGRWVSSTWRALYIDGEQQESSSTLRETPPDTWNVWVGGAYYDSAMGWGCDAYIGDGAIWRRALSVDEIRWYYSDPFVLYKPVAPPAFYSFAEAEISGRKTSGVTRGVLRGVL